MLALAEPSLEEAIAMADKTESAAALYNALCVPPGASAMVVTLPVWAKLRLLAKEGLPFPDVWPEAVVDATLLAAPPTKQALRTVAETEQEVREMVSAVVKAAQLDEVGEGVEDGAVEADATTMSVALSGAAVEEGGDARFDGFEVSKARLRSRSRARARVRVGIDDLARSLACSLALHFETDHRAHSNNTE